MALLSLDIQGFIRAVLQMASDSEGLRHKLHKIALRMNCNLNWLLAGEGHMFENSAETQVNQTNQYAYVPYFESRIGAGRGLIPEVNAEIGLVFRREWIVRFKDPKNVSLIKVEGESMEPTLVSGGIILVDHGKNYVSPQGGVHVITVGEEVMVKRLHVDYSTGKVKVISDNKKYPTFDLSPD